MTNPIDMTGKLVVDRHAVYAALEQIEEINDGFDENLNTIMEVFYKALNQNLDHMVLVPREPSMEMVQIGGDALRCRWNSVSSLNGCAEFSYKAMIQAAEEGNE